MAYQRIFWKDRIVVLNDDGTINKIVQEGTPLSAFNLNHMEEGISKTYNDTDLIKKNQLELLIARDLEDKRVKGKIKQKSTVSRRKRCSENHNYLRPKRLLKRSTRPPVSTSFCLPV